MCCLVTGGNGRRVGLSKSIRDSPVASVSLMLGGGELSFLVLWDDSVVIAAKGEGQITVMQACLRVLPSYDIDVCKRRQC